MKARDAEPWFGVLVVELASGSIVAWIKLECFITEPFDVAVLLGVGRKLLDDRSSPTIGVRFRKPPEASGQVRFTDRGSKGPSQGARRLELETNLPTLVSSVKSQGYDFPSDPHDADEDGSAD
ncbi:hypothetical protein [Novosphingobium sp. Leaf2]|uniref:hypothetical protein n=1 Tax=Novosphingobium sp. Leaf2 TaxID=1735670 RepID=UPI0006F72814|nr:hypothetical protein [Novosphingobium sp. Leaf2]KQM21529.1 hypothetical protein ASE49_14055 [Novosphingobium sp. Leaf2]